MEILSVILGTNCSSFAVTVHEGLWKGRENRCVFKTNGPKTDPKQKMDCYIKCIPFTVYPQEICFPWKKLLSSCQIKPSAHQTQLSFLREEPPLQSCRENSTGARQVAGTGFPPFAFPGSSSFRRFRTFLYCCGLKQKLK